MARVLIVGVYMVGKPSLIHDISQELDRARGWEVEQHWAALGEGTVPQWLERITACHSHTPAGKFTLVNSILSGCGELDGFDYLLVCDDDVKLPDGFIDRYLEIVEEYGFALSQPARSHDSYIDHHFVERLDGLTARRTRFVEIGPLFALQRRAYPYLVPFDDSSSMGWGLDFAWPVQLEEAGLPLGIVDAVPVAHNLRPPVSHYRHRDADQAMTSYLASKRHLTKDDAFSIVESHA